MAGFLMVYIPMRPKETTTRSFSWSWHRTFSQSWGMSYGRSIDFEMS